MKKVLLLRSILEPGSGGGTTVAVWIIEALKRENAVSVLTWTPVVNTAAINRFFGTSLSPSDFKAYRIPLFMRSLIKPIADPYDLEEICLLMRLCKRMSDDHDVIISTDNETDFGCRGIQYIHYPWLHQWQHICRSFADIPSYQRLWSMMLGKYRPWMAISGYSFDRMKKNLTLVNSELDGGQG